MTGEPGNQSPEHIDPETAARRTNVGLHDAMGAHASKEIPLGKLVIEKSYSSKLKKVKATMTDKPSRDAGPPDAREDPRRLEARRLRALHEPQAEA